MSSLTADDIFKSLLQKNYFPAQRKAYGEIPPIFTSEGITRDIANKIGELPTRKSEGFDYINFTSTRFDLVPRILQVPFPKGYIDLCACISKHWNHIRQICYGKMSAIKPTKHEDGRVIIMEYDDREQNELWHIEQSFSKKFGIRSDIANFFPSVYTHSIGWAAVGPLVAKKSKDNMIWYNELDKYQRLTTRNETKGVPIGPATSNIVTEFMLQAIDNQFLGEVEFGEWQTTLSDQSVENGASRDDHNCGLIYKRYIDDYQCYAETREDAEVFVRNLRMRLNEFGLHLNTKKTHIYELPDTSENSWMGEIQSALPRSKTASFLDAKRFLDYIVVLAKKYPSKSIIKYGLKCILETPPQKAEEREAYSKILGYALNLAFHYPAIIPTLSVAFTRENKDLWCSHQRKLAIILENSVEYHRSDAVSWILYLCLICDHSISKDTASRIVKTMDCISITLLYLSSQHNDLVEEYAKELIVNYSRVSPPFELDKQWLLTYQLFLDGKIGNPYPTDDAGYKTFDVLKQNKVTFIRDIHQPVSQEDTAPSSDSAE
jgi:hypothetical protein